MVRYFLRALKWMAILVLGVTLVVLGCWLLLPDEDLYPEAKKLMEARPTVAPEKNAYYLLWGLTAAPELNGHEVGRRIVAAHEQAIRDRGLYAKFDPAPLLGDSPFKRRSPTGLYCRSRGETASCLSALREHQTQLEREIREQFTYLQRYRALREFPEYEEAMTPAPFLLPSYQDYLYFTELVGASIVFDAESEAKRPAAFQDLGGEIQLWKRLVRDSDNLVSKMTYVAGLFKNYQLLSELLVEYPEIARQHPDLLARMTAPLESAHTDMTRALGGEFRVGARVLSKVADSVDLPEGVAPDSTPTWIQHLVYRPNATINLRYEQFRREIDEYKPGRQSGGEDQASSVGYRFSYWDPRWWLYNPVGKILVSIGPPSYRPYADRVLDLAGYSRLLELQRKVALERISPENLTAFLAATAPGLLNPHTGQPMSYDSAAHVISFMPRSPNYTQKGMPLQVKLGR